MSERQPEVRPPAWGDEQIDRVLGNLLRLGVLVSAVVVLAGGLLLLAREGRQANPDLHEFQEEPSGPGVIVRQAVALDSRGLIMLGLLLLIATPVARVVFSVFAFALQRDYLYVLFTVIVLIVLLYSLFSGYFS
jgi:uncharacterized membrane protein